MQLMMNCEIILSHRCHSDYVRHQIDMVEWGFSIHRLNFFNWQKLKLYPFN